jgi:glycosyltransferase involved in cell wall biosynthesis
MEIETASINRPDRAFWKLPVLERAEARSTHYIKDGFWLRTFVTVLATVLGHPIVVLRGLGAIARLRGLSLTQRGRWLFYLAEALLVGRWMQERSLRHLHVHFGGAVASVGMMTSLAWKIPYSLTIHGPEELLNVDAYQLRAKVQQARFVFCISDFCRSQLCQLTPSAEWEKFTVIRLGVDPVVISPPYPKRPANEGPLRLVCTGRLVAAKGHHILLRAIKQLRMRGIELHATLIGKGPEQTSLETFVHDHGLQDCVVFASALSHTETLHLVRSADMFVLASFAEGIPVALMEAMAFAVPCISTTIAGIPELIDSGRDGLLVAPSNVDDLTAAIESLATDPELRCLLGRAGRQRIIRDYNLPLNHERLAERFQQLVEFEWTGR